MLSMSKAFRQTICTQQGVWNEKEQNLVCKLGLYIRGKEIMAEKLFKPCKYCCTDPILMEEQLSPLHQSMATLHKHSLTRISCVYSCMLHHQRRQPWLQQSLENNIASCHTLRVTQSSTSWGPLSSEIRWSVCHTISQKHTLLTHVNKIGEVCPWQP